MKNCAGFGETAAASLKMSAHELRFAGNPKSGNDLEMRDPSQEKMRLLAYL